MPCFTIHFAKHAKLNGKWRLQKNKGNPSKLFFYEGFPFRRYHHVKDIEKLCRNKSSMSQSGSPGRRLQTFRVRFPIFLQSGPFFSVYQATIQPRDTFQPSFYPSPIGLTHDSTFLPSFLGRPVVRPYFHMGIAYVFPIGLFCPSRLCLYFPFLFVYIASPPRKGFYCFSSFSGYWPVPLNLKEFYFFKTFPW